ncbi:MAG: protein kinase [Deltaproteobacteria bacterium]
MTDITHHLSAEALAMFVRGDNAAVDVEALEAHVAGCPSCADRLRREARLEVAMEDLAEQATFCPGCDRVTLDARCDHCGAALVPGGYHIESVLVQTGHARVYRARDRDGELVALKELVFTQVPDVQTLTFFEREAKLLAQLDHPGIPRFVGSFIEGEGVHTRLYLAQEFIFGETLADRLAHHRFTEAELRRIARDVLKILVYLQSVTPPVYHRDVKPANLVMRDDGAIVLVDFGAARDVGTTGGASLVGTFGYIPHEQLVGIVDATSDLYGLGTTLAHLATRRPPWRSADRSQLLRDATLSDPFKAFVHRLAADQRADRFDGAAEALAALDAPAKPRRRVPAWVALAAAAAFVTVGTMMMWVVDPAPPTVVEDVEPVKPPEPPERSERVEPPETVRTPRLPDTAAPQTIELGPRLPHRHAALLRIGEAVVAVGGEPSTSASDRDVRILGENGEWNVLARLVEGRNSGHTATWLEHGTFLVLGGERGQGAEICSLEGWCKRTAQPRFSYEGHVAVRLQDRTVLVAGGVRSPSASERFLLEGRWVEPKSLPRPSPIIGLTATRHGAVGYGIHLTRGHTLVFKSRRGRWKESQDLGMTRPQETSTWAARGVAFTLSLPPRLWDESGELQPFEAPVRVKMGTRLFDHAEVGPILVGRNKLSFFDPRLTSIPSHATMAHHGRSIVALSGPRILLAGDGERNATFDLPKPPPRSKRKRRRRPGEGSERFRAEAFYQRGKSALLMGRLSEAEKALRACVAIGGIPDCYRNLGVLYAKQDDTPRAVHHYRRYLELAPDARDADRVRAMLRSAGVP